MPACSTLFAAFALAQADELQRIQAGETRTLALAPDDAARGTHGPAQALRFELRGPANLVAWAASAAFDPWIEIEDAHGAVVARDDGLGDAHTSVARFLSLTDVTLVLHVGAAAPGEQGELHFHLDVSPETEVTLESDARARAVLAQATAQTEAGDFDAAATLVHAELERLFALPGARDSWSATEALPLLGELAYRQADFETLLELSTRSLVLRTRFLPPGHSLYRGALNNHALALGAWGRAREALEAFEQLLQLCERSLGSDADASINARLRIGMALAEAGETHRAVAWQRDLVTRLAARGDDPRLNGARAKLAEYCMQSGELHTARALFEAALNTAEAAGTDTRLILSLRGDLGWLLWLQGDALAARAVQEPALELATATMGSQDMELQRQRALLALTLSTLGEQEAARELEELAYTAMSARLPPEHPDLVRVRANLAMTRLETGEVEGALDLLEEGVALLEGSKSADDETVLSARRALAHGLVELGRFEEARPILREVAEARARLLPPDHPVLESSRWSCLAVAMRMREREESEQLARVIAVARRDMLIAATRIDAPREVAELAARNGELADVLLSLGAGCGALEPVHALDAAVFTMLEAARGAELASARVLRSAARDDALRGLREAARVASHEVVRTAQTGDPGELAAATRARDQAQRELLASLARASGGFPAPTVEALARELEPSQAALAYRRYRHQDLTDARAPVLEERLIAFVVRGDATLRRFELGPLAPITAAAERWRRAVLAPGEDGAAGERRAAGEALRELVLDPLAPALDGVRSLDVALDDVLHTVALDALPREDGCVGDRLQVRVRAALWELLFETAPRSPAKDLVVCGGIDFGAGSGAASFGALRGSADEAREIARRFESLATAEDSRAHLLLGRDASRARIEALAPAARVLHLATHGYFAGESVRSTLDARDGTGSEIARLDSQVRGMNPMLLCGIALAGANQPADAFGSRAGIVTAEELAGFDLSGCELAVLSACDTSVGIRRAGQGVDSLQKALHMAGARCVVTSLWKVPDEATRELMAALYRGMWSESKNAADALWAAKRELRARRAPPRDWAGWVLSGAAQ